MLQDTIEGYWRRYKDSLKFPFVIFERVEWCIRSHLENDQLDWRAAMCIWQCVWAMSSAGGGGNANDKEDM